MSNLADAIDRILCANHSLDISVEDAHLVAQTLRDAQAPTEKPEGCPDCGEESVVAASGGGVVCKTPGCGYWFCF